MQELTYSQNQPQQKRHGGHREQGPGLQMRREDIDSFLAEQRKRGRRPETEKRYGIALMKLYDWLPADKCVREGTVDRWLDGLMAEGYSPSTLNYYGTVCDRWLKYMGQRRYLRKARYEINETTLPAVSREEYHRLLEAAKELRDERSYLFIKVFANTGILTKDLPLLTAEAARAGELACSRGTVRLPACLCRELLDYAGYNGVSSGPVFAGRSGSVPREAWIAKRLKEASRLADLPEGKGTSSSLRKLYRSTAEELQAGGADAGWTLDELLEQEDAVYGWGI